MDNIEPEKQCAECRKPLYLGEQVWHICEGVLGGRGFVPLEEELLFCSDDCLRKYFAGPAEYVLSRRVP